MWEKLQNFFSKGYKLIAYTAIIFVLALINFYHIFGEKFIKNIIGIVLGIAILLILNKFFINKLNEKKSKRLIKILLIIFFILTYFSVYYFRVKYNWDFKWVMDSAKDIANTGATANQYYFKIFPNNWGALIITTLSMKLFFGSEVGAYVINIIFILMAFIFSMLSAKKIGGNKLAINVMLLLIGFAPLYLYAPIVYTDTLALPFPIATFYLWILAKEKRGKDNAKYYKYLILMTLMGAIGFCIKPVAAIIFIAIFIDMFFTNVNKNIAKNMISEIAVFIVVITFFNILGEKFIINDSKKNDLEFPMTHWVMMGLNKPESEGGTSIGYGAYSQKDADYTAESGNYEKKKEANIEKIKERLNEFGILGYIDFIFKKFNYVWNDETYYAIKLINWDTLNTNSLPYKLIIGEQSYKYFRPYMRHFNNVLFFIIILGLIMDLYKKEKNQELRILGISIVGIAMFLLIWEARSRYIYFLIPIFCILGAMSLINLEKNIEEFMLKKKRK